MPVLLFDIDGTLLTSNGASRAPIETAIREVAGGPIDFSGVSFSGKTDPQIFGEILDAGRAQGVDVAGVDAADLAAAYAREMTAALPQATVTALPGAVGLVRRLAEAGAEMGLLTGNLEPLAYLKIEQIALTAAELPFGAFGSDHADRNALPAIAARRASARYGREVAGAELVVIGDTPRDIACARAAGATAVAVCTGHFDADALRDADVVLESLEAFDVEAFATA